MSLSKLGEMKRLHAIGAGIHWLRNNSKIPVKGGWTSGERDPISLLKQDYKTGYNIGTKLGKPSMIGDKYLAAIDVDVKGLGTKYRKEAEAWLNENFPGLLDKAPRTLSGRGNGSMHIWVLVSSPLDSKKITSSNEIVKVHMPSVSPSKNDKAQLSKKEVDEGFRMRPAWEIDFMCEGRQVVLPPSIHPDSGKPYRWGRPIEDDGSIPYVKMKKFLAELPAKKSSLGRPMGGTIKKFEIVDVEESVLELRLPSDLVAGIYEGSDIEDRSAFCMTVAMSMIRAKFKTSEILGVLTNKDYFIGSAAFDHAKTSNRNRAARWAFDYCLRKAKEQSDITKDFECEVVVYETLQSEEVKKQKKHLAPADLGQKDWKKYLDRTDQDKVKATAKNVVLILENAVGKDLVKYDEFSHSYFFGCENPWGSIVGDKVQDIDYINCRLWFAHSGFKVEPAIHEIANAFKAIGHKNMFHVVREHLEGLDAWDGVPRLSTWMKRLLGAEAPEEYLKAVSRKFLITAVARIYDPGCKVDNTVVFEGVQGIGKSTIGRILATDKWFLDQLPDLHDKDSSQILQGNWFVELGELSSLKRSDIETTKQYLTRSVDKFRPPYGTNAVEFQRQCVFFGTTNSDDYLKDKTGNRRFWPVKLNVIDLKALKSERDQLFAEAVLAYDCGEKLYLPKGIEADAKAVQESRVVEDISDVMLDNLYEWKEALMKARKAFRVKKGIRPNPIKFKIHDLFEDFSTDELDSNIPSPLKDHKKDSHHIQIAAGCLKKLGFENYPCNGRKFWRIAVKKSPKNKVGG